RAGAFRGPETDGGRSGNGPRGPREAPPKPTRSQASRLSPTYTRLKTRRDRGGARCPPSSGMFPVVLVLLASTSTGTPPGGCKAPRESGDCHALSRLRKSRCRVTCFCSIFLWTESFHWRIGLHRHATFWRVEGSETRSFRFFSPPFPALGGHRKRSWSHSHALVSRERSVRQKEFAVR